MKKFLLKITCFALIICSMPLMMGAKSPSGYVYLGGFVTGFEIRLKGAEVLALSDVITENGVFSPSKEAGIKCGDRILFINEREINCAFDISKALESYSGEAVIVRYSRGGEEFLVEVKPKKDVGGRVKLGLFVRDGIDGIGTVTFVKEDLTFMALGHPVCEDGKTPCVISGGNVYPCSVYGAVKGERGKAGELKGMIIGDGAIGVVTGNFISGIKGKFSEGAELSKLNKIEFGEGKVGNAQIYCTVDGGSVRAFDVSIVKADIKDKEDKNYVVKVSDKELIDKTGGIVQGMSGSPIVQGGKLVGAVTHVFVNDPTRGFGISIDNMLAAA